MPKGKNQKFKLYRLAQIMLENTDEEHYITMPEIKEKLEEYEVTADRKSIYNDLKDLEKLGIEVEGEPVRNRYHYHVVERPFELPELKLLVDAIQSSKFITQKKTNTLIKKLEKLVSKYDAQKLQRQVYVSGRIKAMNESIYYTVDAIHNAISENRKIKFQYYQWNVKKEMELRHDGAWYHISPWDVNIVSESSKDLFGIRTLEFRFDVSNGEEPDFLTADIVDYIECRPFLASEYDKRPYMPGQRYDDSLDDYCFATPGIYLIPLYLLVGSENNDDRLRKKRLLAIIKRMRDQITEAFAGQGARTLKWLLEEGVPYIDRTYHVKEQEHWLAGYSLAGLFALWSAYECDIFSGIACCSGSLWFKNWDIYMREHTLKRKCSVYLSLGGKEEKTKNAVMATVGNRTREQEKLLLEDPFAERVVLEWNPGGHFADSGKRLAKGIKWLMEKRY